METSHYLNTRSSRKTALLWVVAFFSTFPALHAQDTLQAMMPGVYRLNRHYTPLYYIPNAAYIPNYRNFSVLHVQTVPLQQLQDWGTRSAIVSRDSTIDGVLNGIVFLNEQADTNAASGFVSRQTEPIRFLQQGSNRQLMPTFGGNPFEQPQNGTFNLQTNWFSLYRHPRVETSSWKDTIGETMAYGTTLTIEAAAFDLFRSISFQRIIYNNTTDSIPLYAKTDTIIGPKAWFQAAENLFIHKDSLNGLWLNVSRFQLVPDNRVSWSEVAGRLQNTSRVEETIGWVRTEDLYRGAWIAHKQEIVDYRFDVAGIAPSDETGYSDRGMLSAIKIMDKSTGKVQQVITHIGAEIMDSLNNCLTFIDANFDGYPDIMSSYANGGAGPNYLNIFYLFNPEKRQFEYNDTLSGLSQVEVDTINQVIRSSWRAGAGQHGSEEYRFLKGKIQQTYRWEQSWSSGYFVQETKSVRQPDGQWKETVVYGTEAQTDTVAIFRKPDEKQKPIVRLPGSGTYFRIAGENPLWYHVTIDYPEKQEGWVRKEAFFPDHWEPLPTTFPQFEFETADDDSGNLLAIRIRDKKSGQPLQVISPIDNNGGPGVLETGDYNNDGRRDFRIRFEDKQPESASLIYLYDKRKNLFLSPAEAELK